LLGGNSDIVADDSSTVFGHYVLSTGIYALTDIEYGGITVFRNVDKYSRIQTV